MDRKQQNVKKSNINKRQNISDIRKKQITNQNKNYPYPTYNRAYSHANTNKYQTNNSRYSNSKYNNRNTGYYSSSREPIKNKKIYRAKKKVKNRNISIISRLFTFIMFIVIISYFGVSIFKSMNKKPIDYETIQYGTIDNASSIKGVIIRDEIVYKASKNGIITFNKSENERVKKGENIASVKNQEAIKNTEEDVEAINQKILQLQEKRDDLSIFHEDVKRIDNQIQKTLDIAINELSTYNISKIYELKDYVSKKLTIRNQMLLSENTGSIQDLSNQKADKEQKINQNIENLLSNDSGILSYSTDGLETTFTFENKDTLTKEQTLMKPENEQEYKVNVLEGEPVFKIVKDNNFYIASYIKTQNISSWEQGETRDIYINDNGKLKPLEVIIDKMDIGEKESYVLMKSNKNMIDFINKRNITFELSKPKEGFKININAIAEEELLKVPTSYIVDGNVNKKMSTGEIVTVPVKLSGQEENGEYTYVSISPGILEIGDFIIQPETKKELQLNQIFTKKGIYIVNSGIYNFKNINTENSVQNDQFIILDTNKNTNIKLYDRYAPDLSVVKGEEIVTK
ncbi:HlyD family efflux transporter periplasmic adaptor subunit [[Clostridium] colinum]|uniref:HlyD family efflux transporter periplasmic adaptor subunit n=1 Tax=[Clostridium] colinum TaxID=36835 RepID=UPI0020255D0F|nr:HlyD family efflux transporter periplasmic adaptor subunit [[Clostridium] colinum]